jgi:hypothetical protein
MARTQVQSELLATNSISGTIIADNAITATHIATNAISGTLIQDSGIVTTMIAANNITATKVVTNAIQTRHIADDQVTADKLANAINTSIAAKLPLAGGTMTGNLLFNDGVSIRNTSGNNLEIGAMLGDGSNTIIKSAGDTIFQYYNGSAWVENVRFDDGNVGIGTASPARKVQIQDTSSTVYLSLVGPTNASAGIMFGDSDDETVGRVTYDNSNNAMQVWTNDSERMRIHANGKAAWAANGIGNTATVARDFAFYTEGSSNGVEVRSNDQRLVFLGAGGSSGSGVDDGYLAMSSQGTGTIAFNANGASYINSGSSDGTLGIGVADPKAKIHTHIASSGGAYHQFTNASTNANSDDGWKIGIHDDENFIIWGQESGESFKVYNNGAYRLVVDHNGAVSVAGSFSKGSGSFKIDHPLPAKKDTHHLVHSFVEAPQADLIYRGTATLSSGSATVNLDTIAGMTEGTYVLLNTNSSCFTSNETDWDAVKGSVSGNTLTITCQNDSSTATVSWLVIGERHDQHMKDTEWTDDNGKVIVEPLKEE